jgi:hypothetical protein
MVLATRVDSDPLETYRFGFLANRDVILLDPSVDEHSEAEARLAVIKFVRSVEVPED